MQVLYKNFTNRVVSRWTPSRPPFWTLVYSPVSPPVCQPGNRTESPEMISDRLLVDISYKDFRVLQNLIKNDPQAAKSIKNIICDNHRIYHINFGIYLFNISIASYFILTNKYMNNDITLPEMIISNTIIPITGMYTIFLPSFMYKYFLHKNIYKQIKNL